MALVCMALIVSFFWLLAMSCVLAGVVFAVKYFREKLEGKPESFSPSVVIVLFLCGGFLAGIAVELMQCIPGG